MSAGTDAEALALELLRWLVSQHGAAVVGAALAAATGGPGMLISDAAVLVGQILIAILAQTTQDKMQAIIDAQYAAVDGAVDAKEAAVVAKDDAAMAAKFPKGTP
jgi:hypothetical protein